MAYYYVQALYAMGRKAEAEAIFGKMLEGYREGTFQNGIGNGGDWKEWDGAPCGYEGLLVDAYYPLTRAGDRPSRPGRAHAVTA